MDTIRSLLSVPNPPRIATPHDPVLNSECCYTFHTPYTTPRGIVVNLNTFVGTVDSMATNNGGEDNDNNQKQQQQQLFVRIVKERVEKTREEDAKDGDEGTTGETKAQPTKLGIGIEGGFQSEQDKYDTISKYSVVVLDSSNKVVTELPYDDETKMTFPDMIIQSVDSIINHAGITVQQDVSVWQLDSGEDIPVSKYAANLPFVDNGITISPNPSDWKCEKSGSTENLWLNLSDGYVGDGRQHWDGSGGHNGALDHFVDTGKQYPLVVKLGTITGDITTADCYSYADDEDGPVKIPNLQTLLEKRGINISSMQKTVKSTAELEVELNANYAFDVITEAGSELQPVSGPGLQGLQNLGNSCYMNSVLQLLLSGTVPELTARYGIPPATRLTDHPFLKAVKPQQAQQNLLAQTTKVASALTSGVFAKPIVVDTATAGSAAAAEDNNSTTMDPKYRLAPRMFKHLIGKDHVDFRTGQQQDAPQFLQYLLEQLDRAEKSADPTLVLKEKTSVTDDTNSLHVSSHLFSFQTKHRLTCSADQKIKYKDGAPETVWSLRIPMDKAEVAVVDDNKMETTTEEKTETTDKEMKSPDHKRQKSEDEKDEKQVPTISLYTCIDEWAKETTVDGMKWSHLQNARHPAREKLGLATCPRYLLVQMQRYELGPDWVPIKLEVNLNIPEEIDLEPYRCTGPKDGEDLVPPEDDNDAGVTGAAAPAAPAAPAIDEAALSQLMDMGFSLNSCKRALKASGGSNVEAAMNWVFEHNTDPDFNDPLPEDDDGAGGGGGTAAAATSSGAGSDSASADAVDEGAVQSLVATLGCFTADQVRAALKATSGAADRAADWLFSHMDDLDGAIAALESSQISGSGGGGGAGGGSSSYTPAVPLDDGPGKYSMVGMISHIGKNTGSGHYVAHLKKDGRWVIFNDEKVALSSHPPFEHAYVYLFQRKDTIGSPDPNY